MRKILAALLMVIAAPLARASDPDLILYLYDLDSTTYVYPRLCTSPGPYSAATCPGLGRVSITNATTSGSASTTVTSATASAGAFRDVAAGDVVVFNTPTGPELRKVTAAASADSITVDSNVTIATAGVGFRWWHLDVGTGAANDGYFTFPGHSNVTMKAIIEQLNVTGGIDLKWECRDTIADRVTIPEPVGGPVNKTATGMYRTSVVDYAYSQCRIGMKIGTSDDGGDTGTDAEQITVTVTKELRP